ncbi:MAG: EpsG family protein [Sarcina sp.]
MIYLILLIILMAFAFTDYIEISHDDKRIATRRKVRSIFYVGIIIVLIIICGFRYYTGFDYANYVSIFQEIGTGVHVSSIEIGYKLLNELVAMFSQTVMPVFIIVAVVTLTLKGIAIKKESEKIFLSLFICYTLYFLIGDMGQVRSTLAQSIDLVALVLFLNGRKIFKIIAFILIIVGSLFHASSIVVMIIFLTRDIKLKLRTYAGIYILLAIVGNFLNLQKLGEIGHHIGGFIGNKIFVYTNNLEFVQKVGISFNVIFDFVMIIFLLYVMYNYGLIKNRKFRILFNMYFLSVCSYLIFNNYFVLAVRFANYFRLALIFLVPMAISSIPNKKIRMFILGLIIFAFSLMVLSLLRGDSYMYMPYRMNLFGHIIGGLNV